MLEDWTSDVQRREEDSDELAVALGAVEGTEHATLDHVLKGVRGYGHAGGGGWKGGVEWGVVRGGVRGGCQRGC